MIIAQVNKKGKLKIIDREREVMRLTTENHSSSKLITPNEIKKSIEILRRFKTIIKLYDAELMAVATSAVRESVNKEEFVEQVLKSVGINIEVINGKKEAELIYLGIKNAIDISHGRVLCIDIGGGSTEIISSVNGEVQFIESVRLGAVKLTKLFFPDFIINDKRINECREFIRSEITKNKHMKTDKKYNYMIGSSGTIEASAAMINFEREGKKIKIPNNFSFTHLEFNKLKREVLSARTIEERLKIKGMESKRADIIQSGIIILDEIFNYFNIKKVVISKYALREGAIYSLVNDRTS